MKVQELVTYFENDNWELDLEEIRNSKYKQVEVLHKQLNVFDTSINYSQNLINS